LDARLVVFSFLSALSFFIEQAANEYVCVFDFCAGFEEEN